jgi:hypothetical protein
LSASVEAKPGEQQSDNATKQLLKFTFGNKPKPGVKKEVQLAGVGCNGEGLLKNSE